jgi:hypothetical protein
VGLEGPALHADRRGDVLLRGLHRDALPRGTVVVICGAAACIERVINDYGPIRQSRVVDLYKPDFFEVCGCEWWEGIAPVTVRVY